MTRSSFLRCLVRGGGHVKWCHEVAKPVRVGHFPFPFLLHFLLCAFFFNFFFFFFFFFLVFFCFSCPRRGNRSPKSCDRVLGCETPAGSARFGAARPGWVRLGSAGLDWARLGWAWLDWPRLGWARLGLARLGVNMYESVLGPAADGGGMDFARLFSVPMWMAIGCAALLLVAYPSRVKARVADPA